VIASLEVDWDEAVAAPTPELRINLRDYQQAARAAVQSGWGKFNRQLLDMATGTGKTSICSIMARDRWLQHGGRTLVLENRDALVRQTAKRLSSETGLDVDIEMAGEHASPFAPIVVASVQTLCRTGRLTGFSDSHFQQVIADESHHSLSKSWAKVLCYFHYGAESLAEGWKPPVDGSYQPKCDVLGVTATPELSSKRNLGEFYQTIAYRYQLLNAVKDGWLVMPRAIMEPLAINFKGLRATRTSHGSDYNPTEVAERMIPVIEALASRMAFHGAGRKGMAFMPSVKTAEMLAEALNRNGLRAIFVSGECLDRDEKTDVFVDHDSTTGTGIMLCTAALYTEGFDVPDVDFVFAGITKSRSYYRQKIGRATRPLKGTVDGLFTAEERRAAIAASAKPNFLIYDPFCKCDEIELCDAYDLVTDRPEIKERMKAEGPLEEASAEKAERDFIKSLEKEAKKHAAKKARTVDPLAWAVSLGDSAISSYTPKDDWESHPASVGQLDLIKRFGFNVEGVKTKGIASRIIARLNARASMHLATPKQLHLMHQLGLDEQTCATLTQAEATATIDRILQSKRERGGVVPVAI
jgi:superfamily II DNA or RNA helicase